MKEFVRKVIFFIIPLLVCYILVFACLKIKLENEIYECDAIILGDSHTQTLDIPNFYNYSFGGSPYIIHYNFIKSIEGKLKGKTVVIAFGFHNIGPLYENRFQNNVVETGWISMVNRHLNAVSFLPIEYNYSWQNIGLESIFAKSKIETLFKLIYPESVINNNKVTTDTISFKHSLEKHYTKPGFISADIIQEKYLYLIIELLTKQDCDIILLNTPVVKYYFDNLPAYIKEKHSNLVSGLESAQYHDLNKLLEDQIDYSIFRDADHVNLKGDSLIVKYIMDKVVHKNP